MSKGRVVALVPDLFFSVRVADVLRQLGYQPQLVERREQLEEALAEAPALLIVDISSPPAIWSEVVRALKADPARAHIPVLAFGSHMDLSRQQLARAVGCDRLVANSKFNESLPSIVASMADTTSS
jgi:CheY-like chemotaxis protein